MKLPAAVSLTLALLALTQNADSQTLDERAWNHTWDRLEKVVRPSGVGTGEQVNVLQFPRPLAGGIPGTFDPNSIVQLQNIAGIIPKPTFSLDPSDQDRRLHDVYRTIITSLRAPKVSKAKQKRIDEAAAAYTAAFTAYDEARIAWAERIDSEMERIKRLGGVPTEADYFRIRDATSASVAEKANRMAVALTEWHNTVPSDWALSSALLNLAQATGGIGDALTSGTWRYAYSEPIAWGRESCGDDGWYELAYTHDVASQNTRSSSWNAGGGWSGSFLKIGANAGGGNYSNVITDNNDSIKVRFCQLRFVGVTAPWLNMEVLRGIDAGLYPLKADSPLANKRILGPDGLIPRMVKGLIIARDVQLHASLRESQLSEMRRQFGGSGGFGIGPLRFGGSGSRTEYKIDKSDATGKFGLSTNYGSPVVIAIVIEETESSGLP